MRRKIVEIMEALDIDYEVVDVERASVATADELFVSNSQFGVLPVRQYERASFAPGKLTRRIMQALAGQGVTECRV
jgi:4-amino-4-deoxychorismate lyase